MKQNKFSDERPDVKTALQNLHLNRLPLTFILDGLTDIGNIGMIFRLADALRTEQVLFHNTPSDLNIKKLEKTSRNTLRYVPHRHISIEETESIKQTHELVALDITDNSIEYRLFKPTKASVALIIGSERFGISSELLNLADSAVHLPVNGINTSINAATAGSVAAYHIASLL